MGSAESRQTQLVDVKTQLSRRLRDELDAKAEKEGMRRATYLRRLVIRDLRGEPVS
jgi:hypothetical protein